MDFRIISGPCNCLTAKDVDVTHKNLLVLDSNNLPLNRIFAIAISLNGLFYEINLPFSSVNSLLLWLNTIFVPALSLNGIFENEDNVITYTNPEHFETSEIMAILGTTLLCYKFGLGGPVPIDGYTDILANGDTIPGTALIGKKVLEIKWIDATNDIPLTLNNLSQDSLSKAITFTQPYFNGNMWVLVSDEIPGFPYVLPLTLG